MVGRWNLVYIKPKALQSTDINYNSDNKSYLFAFACSGIVLKCWLKFLEGVLLVFGRELPKHLGATRNDCRRSSQVIGSIRYCLLYLVLTKRGWCFCGKSNTEGNFKVRYYGCQKSILWWKPLHWIVDGKTRLKGGESL